MKTSGLTILLLVVTSGILCAQNSAWTASPAAVIPYRDESDTAGTSEIIFSNLTSSSGNLFNSDPDEALVIAGKEAPGTSEEWFAVEFTPKFDVRAKVLEAAVGLHLRHKKSQAGSLQ